MGKFDNYSVKVTKNTVIEYEMLLATNDPDQGAIVLQVRPAWDINTDYTNARLRTSRRAARVVQKKGQKNLSAADIRAMRDGDYRPYAEHILAGWSSNVCDVDGKHVPFTADDAEDFLRAIPESEFDELRSFCTDYTNWGLDPVEADEVAGNS